MKTPSHSSVLLGRSRSNPTRNRQIASSMIAIAFLVALLYLRSQILGSSRLRRTRTAARLRQTLVGYTEDRLVEFRKDVDKLSLEQLLIHDILYAHSTPSCQLDPIHIDRYAPLLSSFEPPKGEPRFAHDLPRNGLSYFIALNLFSSETVLTSLIHAIHSLVIALGPHRFHVSIYENGSTDSTPLQLYIFAAILRELGVGYTITSDSVHKAAAASTGGRIEALAAIRNLALGPLKSSPPGTYDRVLFLNDVHLCGADLMELILQHEVQEADMSCGMDYKELRIKEFKESGYPLLFYDTWVARDMMGLPFYNIKWPSGDWELPTPPLPHSPSRFRSHSLLPFQVYSCFNGVTIIRASLFLPPFSLTFHSDNGTNTQSECYILCRDIWRTLSPWTIDGTPQKNRKGGRIQVVPRVSVGYDVMEYERARQDRNLTGFRNPETREETNELEMIKWEVWPPKRVASYPRGMGRTVLSKDTSTFKGYILGSLSLPV